MKFFPFSLLLAFFLLAASCSEDSVSADKNLTADEPFGWMDAGFTPDPATLNKRGGGLQKIVHSGKWIVLMDAWTSPVDSHPGYSTWTPRLFASKMGTNAWDTIKPPTNENVNRLYADSLGIYVGMKDSARLFQYIPETKEWKSWKLLDTLEPGGWFTIYGIARFQNRLIVSLAGYKNSEAEEQKDISSFVKWQNDSIWEEIDSPQRLFYSTNDSGTIPFQFHKGIEWQNKLFVATGDGVWMLNSNGSRWSAHPSLPQPIPFTRNNVSHPVIDITIHKDNLYAVDERSALIFQFNESECDWEMIDSLYFENDSSYDNAHVNTPPTIYSMASSGEHLFISGQSWFPMVYMGDYGEPYGNIPKGFRKVGNMCASGICLAGGGARSIDVIGDTLYVAAWKRLVKFPLDLLDSAISGVSDYNF